jgi:hypothetical protein
MIYELCKNIWTKIENKIFRGPKFFKKSLKRLKMKFRGIEKYINPINYRMIFFKHLKTLFFFYGHL